MISVFLEDCNESSFYKHIWQPEEFLYLNGKKVIYPWVAEIVVNYIEADDKNVDKLKKTKTHWEQKIIPICLLKRLPIGI